MTAAEWPFLAVLLSQPAPGKGPDRESAPRVRGLGCVMGDTLVTAAYLGDLVDLYLLGDGSPAPLHHVGGDAAVAVMGPVAAKAAPATPGSAAAGVPCRVALVSDSSPRFRVLDGRTGEIGADGRFTVELDGRLGEDETAGGSPVVAADGTVVGVVGPTATSTSVDAVALRRAVAGEAADGAAVRSIDPQQAVEGEAAADGAAVRSIATQRALDYAVALVTSTSLGAAPSLILGVLRSVDARRTVPRAVHDLVAERAEPAHGKRPGETIDAIVAALGFPVPAYPPPAPEHDAFTRPDLGPLVGEAEAARIRLGADDRLHRRHLLAAALMRPPAEFPERLIALLGTSLPELRAELRAAIAQTDEPQAAWDAILAGPAPNSTLAGGISSDLVDPTRGHRARARPPRRARLRDDVRHRHRRHEHADAAVDRAVRRVGLRQELLHGAAARRRSRRSPARGRPATTARSCRSASTPGTTRTATCGRASATRSSSSSPGRARPTDARRSGCARSSPSGSSAARSSRPRRAAREEETVRLAGRARRGDRGRARRRRGDLVEAVLGRGRRCDGELENGRRRRLGVERRRPSRASCSPTSSRGRRRRAARSRRVALAGARRRLLLAAASALVVAAAAIVARARSSPLARGGGLGVVSPAAAAAGWLLRASLGRAAAAPGRRQVRRETDAAVADELTQLRQAEAERAGRCRRSSTR